MRYDRPIIRARRSFLRLLGMGTTVSLLGGCGFTPLYGQSAGQTGRSAVGLNNVAVATIAERTGQILRRELQLQISGGRPSGRSLFRLEVDLGERITSQALLDDDSASFARLDLIARYRLIEVRSGALATSGETVGSSSFNVVQSQFANLSAEDGAREQAALLVASDITRRLALFFNAA